MTLLLRIVVVGVHQDGLFKVGLQIQGFSQLFVGLIDLNEPFGRNSFIFFMAVRMPLQNKNTIRVLDLVRGRLWWEPKGLVRCL